MLAKVKKRFDKYLLVREHHLRVSFSLMSLMRLCRVAMILWYVYEPERKYSNFFFSPKHQHELSTRFLQN